MHLAMAWYRSRRSSFRNYMGFAPYVPVAERRAQAARAAAKATREGKGWSPVVTEGRKIATTFWGKAWCDHLESYSDFANRLPRGRTYVRNGSVVDLQIARGEISARIQGSSLYRGKITIKPLAPARWKALKAACAGQVTSLVSLLQGRLPETVLRAVTDRATGLFPAPNEIQLDCSCPDFASLCKHLAAVLYGVGTRLDTQPELLFLLRGVDHQELVSEAVAAATRAPADGAGAAPIGDAELADVFGIEISAGDAPPAPAARKAAILPPQATTRKTKLPGKRPRGRPRKTPAPPASASGAPAAPTPAAKPPAPAARKPRRKPTVVRRKTTAG